MRKRNVNSVVCLTEESVETLYLLGKEELITGISVYAVRPEQAKTKTIVTSFIKANLKKILEIKPDLIIGFSDIQKDIARELIEAGQDVYISNQRSLEEILNYIYQLSLLVDAKDKGIELIQRFEAVMDQAKARAAEFKLKPKFYFEEWDEPMICSIRWVSELIELCGGQNIFKEQSLSPMAKERFVDSQGVISADPDVIFACWCGKKVDLDSINNREGWQNLKAVRNKRVFELEPEIFLQPGPALFIDGFEHILKVFEELQS